MTTKHWSLRDELYRVYHNWPALVAFFLIGALLGWAASFLWPAYHQAAQTVYVALNPYRTYSDERFLALARPRYANIDNYHYWQMYQLETAINRNEIMKQSIERLAASDPYWQAVTPVELRGMLSAEWRTAGEWRLIAEHADESRARQALEVWADVAIQSTQDAVTASRDLMSLDQQLAGLGAKRLHAQMRLDALRASEEQLPEVLAAVEALDPQAPLPAELRWRLFSLTSAHAADDPAWQALLAETPGADASAAQTLSWAAAARSLMQGELDSLPNLVAALNASYDTLRREYKLAADQSLGLSPNLEVEGFGEIETQAVRPDTTLALIGGFIGLIAWLVMQIGRVQRGAARSIRRPGEQAPVD